MEPKIENRKRDPIVQKLASFTLYLNLSFLIGRNWLNDSNTNAKIAAQNNLFGNISLREQAHFMVSQG